MSTMKATAYTNSKIFTSDDANLYADAMLVEGERIKWVGKEAEMPAGDYETVDLKRKAGHSWFCRRTHASYHAC